MKKNSLVTNFIICLFSFSVGFSAQAKAPKEIVIGVQPNEAVADVEQFRSELEAKISIPVKIVKPKDYSELVDKFKSNAVDFAFFSPLNFIQAEREAQAKVLLKKVYGKDEFYYAALVSLKKNKLKKIADLKSKRIGFVDKKSTSGYLYGRYLLRSKGLDAGEGVSDGPNTLKYEFFGTHDAALQALIDGKVDVVSVWSDSPEKKTGVWTNDKFKHISPSTFHIIIQSEPIPNDAFAVREKFFQEQALVSYSVMEAIISLSDSPDSTFRKLFGTTRMATATSRHYDSVRKLESILAK